MSYIIRKNTTSQTPFSSECFGKQKWSTERSVCNICGNCQRSIWRLLYTSNRHWDFFKFINNRRKITKSVWAENRKETERLLVAKHESGAEKWRWSIGLLLHPEPHPSFFQQTSRVQASHVHSSDPELLHRFSTHPPQPEQEDFQIKSNFSNPVLINNPIHHLTKSSWVGSSRQKGFRLYWSDAIWWLQPSREDMENILTSWFTEVEVHPRCSENTPCFKDVTEYLYTITCNTSGCI